MISSVRKKSVIAAVAVTSFALVASAVPANAVDGVSATEIKLGITVPQTGPASTGYNKVAPAMKAYFEYINANGGVYGRKINLIIKDDGYKTQAAIDATNDLLLQEKVFALVGQLGTANHIAVASKVQLAKRGVPSLYLNTGFSEFADKSKYATSFMHFPSYATEAKVLASYIKENFAGKKACLLAQADDFGDDAAKGFATAGLTFGETVRYVSGTQSSAAAAGWVQKFAGAKCEVVVTFSVTTATTVLLGAAAALKFAPQWILGSVGADPTTIRIASGNPQATALLNNAISASWLPDAADTNDRFVKFFREVNAKYNNNVDFDANVMVGMNAGMLTVQALRAAGRNPTRQSLINAIETKGRTFVSAAFAPYGVSKSTHAGYTGFWIGKFNASGALSPVDAGRTIYVTDSAAGPVNKVAPKRAKLPAKGIPTNS
jgi:ABC-type branched-subunit amino acid transport system substrate-binding protein